MKLWPFGRTEKREAASYGDAVIDAIVERSAGAVPATPTATGALQACSGMVARCFAAAAVSGPATLTAAVTPAVLSLIGRALIRRGEVAFLIDVADDGRVRLLPAVGDFDVHGTFDPESWVYRLNLGGPSSWTTLRDVPAAAVVHPRFEVDPDRPWRGIGPIQSAALAGRLSAETAAALADAESGPRGQLLPLPVDGEDPTITALKADIRTLRGRLAFVESVKIMHPGAVGNAPSGDWDVKRIGADPPRAEVDLLGAAALEVYSACGVPPALFRTGEGTAQRESFRRLLHSTVQPLGRIVSAELSEKLNADVSLSFDPLFAADLSGRARAFQSLVGGGMDPGKAAGLAGLMESD